jgi:hypothetical protein
MVTAKCPDRLFSIPTENKRRLSCPGDTYTSNDGVLYRMICLNTSSSDNTRGCFECPVRLFSIPTENKCLPCPFGIYTKDHASCTCINEWILLVTISIMFFFLVLLFRKLVVYMKKYPGAVGGTIASVSIVTSHAQMMLVMSHLNLSWPAEVKQAQKILYAFTLDLPHLFNLKQCLLVGSTVETIWVGVLIFFIVLLILPTLFKVLASCSDFEAEELVVVATMADKMYNLVALMMSFMIIKFVNIIIDLGGQKSMILLFFTGFGLSCILLKFFRDLLTLHSKWDGRIMCILKPTNLSERRLKIRLSYLAARYAPHAPYWQFVVWSRQIGILILSTFSSAWLIILVSTLICLTSLILHIKIKPFKYEFQNRMENWLMLTIVVMINAAGIYSEVLRPYVKNNSSNPASWVVAAIILIAMFGSLIGASLYFRLFRKLYKSFVEMIKQPRKGSTIELRKPSASDGKDYALLLEDGGGSAPSEKEASEIQDFTEDEVRNVIGDNERIGNCVCVCVRIIYVVFSLVIAFYMLYFPW